MATCPVVVVDASLALHAVVRTSLSDRADHVWRELSATSAVVYAPRLFSYEVTSVIHRYLHDRHLTVDQARSALETTFEFGVTLIDEDLDLCRAALSWASRLSHKPAYDAFYVALADRLDGELWTADRRLVNALQSSTRPTARWIGGRP